MPSLWLDRAQQLMQLQLHQFADVQEGDFYFTSEDRETPLVRNKEYFAPPQRQFGELPESAAVGRAFG